MWEFLRSVLSVRKWFSQIYQTIFYLILYFIFIHYQPYMRLFSLLICWIYLNLNVPIFYYLNEKSNFFITHFSKEPLSVLNESLIHYVSNIYISYYLKILADEKYLWADIPMMRMFYFSLKLILSKVSSSIKN